MHSLAAIVNPAGTDARLSLGRFRLSSEDAVMSRVPSAFRAEEETDGAFGVSSRAERSFSGRREGRG